MSDPNTSSLAAEIEKNLAKLAAFSEMYHSSPLYEARRPKEDKAIEIEIDPEANLAKIAAFRERHHASVFHQEKSEPRSQSGSGSSVGLSTQEIPALKRPEEKKPIGFGRKFRARIRRERIARLLDPVNRAKNSLVTKLRHNRSRAEKAELRRAFERAINNGWGTCKPGYRDNFLPDGTRRFRKLRFTGNRYTMTTKHLQALADRGREWAHERLWRNQFFGFRTTHGLPPGRFSGYRSNLERKLVEMMCHLVNPESLRYTERMAHFPVEQYVDWMGFVQPYTPDFVHDTIQERLYIETKGTKDLLARLKKSMLGEDEALYRQTRKDILRIAQRLFCNLIIHGYNTDTYRPELLYFSGPTIDRWTREGRDLTAKGFTDYVRADSDRFIEYLNEIFFEFFPEEAQVWISMAVKVTDFLASVYEVDSWSIGGIFGIIQSSLAEAKSELGYDDSEKGIRKRLRVHRYEKRDSSNPRWETCLRHNQAMFE